MFSRVNVNMYEKSKTYHYSPNSECEALAYSTNSILTNNEQPLPWLGQSE